MQNTPNLADYAALGYRWCAFKAAHGLQPDNTAEVDRQLDIAEAVGMRRVIWTWVEGDPRPEAVYHSSLISSHKAEGLIVNAEVHYEGDNAWKSREYVEELRTRHPELPIAVSVLGGASIPEGHDLTPWQRPFDHEPWLDAGAIVMPQAYWNMADPGLPAPGSSRHDHRPANCVRCWQNRGVPIHRIALTFGLWEVPSPVSASAYVADTPKGIAGFNSYLLEQYPVPAEYEVLIRGLV